MAKRSLRCLAIIFFLMNPTRGIDRDHYTQLVKQLGERVAQKDWQGARDVLAEIGRELPGSTPRFLLLNALVETHLGHKAEAIKWLEKYAATGLTFEIAKDPNLKTLLDEAAGQKVAAQMKENSKPVTNAERVSRCRKPTSCRKTLLT